MTLRAAIIAAATLSAILAQPALADDDKLTPKQIAIFAAVSNESAACFAYYMFVKICAPESATPAEIEQVLEFAKNASDFALLAGRAAGISDTDITANVQAAVSALAKMAEGKCTNHAAIVAKYNTSCRTLREHPELRGKQLMDQQNSH